MTYQGQPIIYRTSSTGYHYGFIAGNITNGGDTADVLVHVNGNQWEDTGNTIMTTAIFHPAVDFGPGVGEWALNSDLPPAPPSLDEYLSPSAPENNSRSLNSAFQPSSTRPVLVSYSVRVVSGISLSGGASGRVELLSDASNPPTTSRGRVAGGVTGTVVVGLSISDTAEGTLTYLVPAGHFVKLGTTNETGTPTYTLTQQHEIVM